jgi:hypothetical protein
MSQSTFPTIKNTSPGNNHNQFNSGNLEKKESNLGVSSAKVSSVKAATTRIIQTRDELAKYLLEHGIKLLTSAKIFADTGDFIESSFVIYLKHGEYKESLQNFLQKNPGIIENTEIINNTLKPFQKNMQLSLDS